MSAEQLLADTIKSPGSYSQMCDPPPQISPKIPLPLFEKALLRDFYVSGERLDALKARRDEIIPALKKLLVSIDPGEAGPAKGRLIKSAPGEESGEVLSSGVSPRQLSGLLLGIVADLEVVEVLPELLGLEERLRAALERADNDPKAITPSVADDGSFSLKGNPKLSKREKEMVRGRIVQREMLSLMLQLLRQQRFQPMLDSDFEKTYAAAIIKRAKEDPEIGRKGSVPWVDFDPIYRVQLGYIDTPPSVPFSREVREKVRGLVQAYLKSAPAPSRRAG